MEGKIARISWSRGKYSDVFRSTIVDPSPLKHGQTVKVLWGKTKKELSAVVTCYPVQEETENPETITELAPRRARAKRKLVSICLIIMIKPFDSAAFRIILPCYFASESSHLFWS